jgi:hypothetical protein
MDDGTGAAMAAIMPGPATAAKRSCQRSAW